MQSWVNFRWCILHVHYNWQQIQRLLLNVSFIIYLFLLTVHGLWLMFLELYSPSNWLYFPNCENMGLNDIFMYVQGHHSQQHLMQQQLMATARPEHSNQQVCVSIFLHFTFSWLLMMLNVHSLLRTCKTNVPVPHAAYIITSRSVR